MEFTHFPADVSIYDNSVYYQYAEFISKNNQHRFKNIDLRNKQARAYIPCLEVIDVGYVLANIGT